MNICSRCGRDAPIVYRGVVPYCTACGAPRVPLSGPSVNHAGKPSRVGGAVTRWIGWLILLFGLSTALGLGLLLAALASLTVGLAVALPVAIVALVLGIALVGGGRALQHAGTEVQRTTHEQALLAMIGHRGALTAADAAQSLGVSFVEADAMLTAMAKADPDRVTVDVDDQGVVWYRAALAFAGAAGPWPGAWPAERVRVAPNVPPQPRVADDRMDAELAADAEADSSDARSPRQARASKVPR